MKAERWEKAKNIFEQAMVIAPDERVRFLDEVCSDDKTVRREVEELLSSFDETESFLETPAVSKKKNELERGQILGHYEIVEPIGAGGMGEVYQARDTRLKRKAALKLLPAEFTANRERLRRFEQEAFAASSLNHPNILTIYEIAESEGINFIAAEFVEGETLRSFTKHNALTFQEILDIVAQIVSALADAHETGIVHRDIKPENIMIRRDGLVKVLDFGLAKTVKSGDKQESSQYSVHTEQGVILGTVAYMSPEQTRSLRVDMRTDIWSLGVVLYEMIAGRPPFQGETTSDVIAAILKTTPEPLPAETPAELQRIIAKTLRHAPDERYQTAKDLLVDLKNLKQDLEFNEKLERKAGDFPKGRKTVARSENTNEQTRTTASIEYVKTHKLPAILALVVLLTGVSAIAFYFRQNQSTANKSTETTKIDSLAVLPFENASPETEYLSDGITESLINSLSNLPNLRVVSRGTVFSCKGRNDTPQDIGKTLNVRTVLTGKISQQDDSFIIQAELIDITDNAQIWGERYNTKMSDLLQVQGQIAQQISDKLQLKLNNRQKANIARHYTENAEAYREYLKGRFYTLRFTFEEHKKALEHLNRALEIDPTYALAYAGIADAYTTVSDTFLPPRDALAKAKSAANKALEIDNELPEAWAALGHAKLHEWDKSAIDELNKAIELAPNTMTNYLWLSEYYNIFAPEKTAAVLEKAAELDPLSPVPPGFLAYNYVLLRQYEKALESAKKAAELLPNNPIAAGFFVKIYEVQGDYQSAAALFNQIPPEQMPPFAIAAKARILALMGQRQEAEKLLAKLKKMSEQQYISPFDIAGVYVGFGDRDEAFFYLEKAYQDHSEYLGFIRNDPSFDSIRDDARYTELMRKISFAK